MGVLSSCARAEGDLRGTCRKSLRLVEAPSFYNVQTRSYGILKPLLSGPGDIYVCLLIQGSRSRRYSAADGGVDIGGDAEAVDKTLAPRLPEFDYLLRRFSFFPEIGDFVERDEEIATIETDKVRRGSGREGGGQWADLSTRLMSP